VAEGEIMQGKTTQMARGYSPRRKALAVAVAVGLGGQIWQAGAQEAVPVLSEVKVTGQAASLDNALDIQQAADNIVSVVHADAIGQLPDTNAAEALQRLPGVSVERDQGEGRYVRIRGLAPDLNAVTINGSLVPAPESGVRAIALDTLPAGLISSLTVTKTLTPDQDANSIGGSIDIKTISAFDHKDNFYTVEGGMSHDSNLGKSSPYGVAAFSKRFLDGKLGIAAGISSDKREFGSDNVETGGAWDQSGATPALESFQRRDYHITRKRDGGVFNLDYRPLANESYFLRTAINRYSDTETRQRHDIVFNTPQAEGILGGASSSYELKSRTETHDIFSTVLGMNRQLGDWDLALALGISQSSQDTPDYISSAKFKSSATYQVGFRDSERPELIGDPVITSASAYKLDAIKMEDQYTEDKEHNLRLDLGRHFKWGEVDNELKFGAKTSRRTKTNEFTAWKIKGSSFGKPGMSGFVSDSVDYPYGNFGMALSPSALYTFADGVDKSAFLDSEASSIDDFSMHEDIDAGYIQNTFSRGLWRILAGVRYEGTRFRAQGYGLDNGAVSTVAAERSYRNWLPALHIRRDLDNDTSVRAAWTHSVVRPTFSQLAPGFTIDGNEAEFGNPFLNPWRSTNFDLGIERRLGYAGVLSAYVFHKDIKDFVYATDLAGTGIWSGYVTAKTYANGSQAKVNGLELAYAQTFRHLPAPWNGLLLSSNATFTNSDARIEGRSGGVAASRSIPLPSQSDVTFNLTVGYEKGPLGMRLAANHKSKYLLEVGNIASAKKDMYVDAQTQYDFSAHYDLSKQVQLVFEALNLSREKYYVYTGQHGLNGQYETYGRTYRLGLKVASF
jgi:TonB-dependent receptor